MTQAHLQLKIRTLLNSYVTRSLLKFSSKFTKIPHFQIVWCNIICFATCTRTRHISVKHVFLSFFKETNNVLKKKKSVNLKKSKRIESNFNPSWSFIFLYLKQFGETCIPHASISRLTHVMKLNFFSKIYLDDSDVTDNVVWLVFYSQTRNQFLMTSSKLKKLFNKSASFVNGLCVSLALETGKLFLIA